MTTNPNPPLKSLVKEIYGETRWVAAAQQAYREGYRFVTNNYNGVMTGDTYYELNSSIMTHEPRLNSFTYHYGYKQLSDSRTKTVFVSVDNVAKDLTTDDVTWQLKIAMSDINPEWQFYPEDDQC